MIDLAQKIREKLHGEDPYVHELKRNVPAVSFALGAGAAGHFVKSKNPYALVLAPVIGGIASNTIGNTVAGIETDVDQIATTSGMSAAYGALNLYDHYRHTKGLAPNILMRDGVKGAAMFGGGMLAVAAVKAAIERKKIYDRSAEIGSFKDSISQRPSVPIQA